MGSSHDSAFLLAPANEVCEGNVFIGVCLSTRGVSVQGSLSSGYLSSGSLSMGVSVHGGLCPWGSLSRGVSVQGVSVYRDGDLCPGGSLSRWSLSMGVSIHGGSLSRRVSVQDGGDLCSRGVSVRETPFIVKCGEYASYWNAFLFLVNSN